VPTRCRHPVHNDGEDRSQYFIRHSPGERVLLAGAISHRTQDLPLVAAIISLPASMA
jgi:hypothetical protein